MKYRNHQGRFVAKPLAMEDEGQKYRGRLRELREARKLSQAALGELFGAAQSTMGGYERGPNEVSVSDILKLAEIYEVAPEWIAFGHECPPQPPPADPNALDRTTVKNVIAAVISVTRENDLVLPVESITSNVTELSSLLRGRSAADIRDFVEALYLRAK